MFQCRMCTENPFALLFGEKKLPDNSAAGGAASSEARAKEAQKKQAKDPLAIRKSRPQQHRTPAEVEEVIKKWEQCCHARALEYFVSEEVFLSVLRQIATCTSKTEDPILGGGDECVIWYGEATQGSTQAALRVTKPGEEEESITYVNRVLAFIFATDESFQELMKLPREPFVMACGNQLCTNLSHISVAV
mmetsp:Transcript_98703/g.205748  ORF Transcript_98703/g.205748 Transcript_98703/m.205748 type:complete len:191 (+) Transcript_98703:209-781(+)|eukprot:CAMPEP_0206500404 /NCGR_PEP_ID=MMETSP0324_2-20121206/52427_1 /ASSEMBLY_ACC=CAM_ASM_000836 /TAXON_ID=2866 /ORGANISM="Crypthecodinium cohnii, Strain Seligo" /LENGTH=190 /DNA_ID=CAMNT_0053987491 /DNA_START=204 /DNA_END=776 /DNA_ORIENTATION=+